MSKDGLGPYIPIYWDDLVGGTLDFGSDEFGAYMLLLGHQWTRGGIDPSPQVVERISRCEYRKLSRVIEKFNLCPDGMLRNKRMECVRNERIAYVQTRSKSAKARWGNVHTDMRTHVHTDMRSGMRKEDIPSPSPSPSPSALPHPSPSLPAPLSSPVSDARLSGELGKFIKMVLEARPEFIRLNIDHIANELRLCDPSCLEKNLREFCADACNSVEVKNPMGMLRKYLARNTLSNSPAKPRGFGKTRLL